MHSIDEGSGWFSSAELRLRFGVDDEAGQLNRDGVENGDTIAIGKTILLRPYLDGELWCYGWEEDLGSSIIDKDDPLPFGVQRLPRDADGAFAEGPGVLWLEDRNGTSIELRYEVHRRA